MRILFVGNHAGHFVSHRLPIAKCAREAGYEVQIATPFASESQTIIDAGFPYYPIRLQRQGKLPWVEAETLRGLYRLFKQVKPDLVHNFTAKPVIYGGIAAQFAHVPAVVNSITGLGTVFVDNSLKSQALGAAVKYAYRFALRHPNAIHIFQNPDDQAVFVDEQILKAEQTRLVKGSGVDTSQFVPQPFHEGAPVVVLAARMMWEKGVGEYVDAVRALRSDGVTARFLLVGESDPEHQGSIPREQLQAWHDSGVVEWLGHCSDMAGLFAQAHVVCLPSYYREGVPKVLIEAAACARPIVTTDNPGCREIVHDQVNGLLIEKHNIVELAAALKFLIDNPASRQQMGDKGRELVVAEFSLEHVVSQILEIYQTLLAKSA